MMRFNIQYTVNDVVEEVNDILSSKFTRLERAYREMDHALKSDNLILFREKLKVSRDRVREFDLRLKDGEEIVKGYMEHLISEPAEQDISQVIQDAKDRIDEAEKTVGDNYDNQVG